MLNCCVEMYSVFRLYLLSVQIIVVICVESSKLIKHLLDLIKNERNFFRLAKCQKYYLDGGNEGLEVYSSLTKVESLDNAIQECLLAQPSRYIRTVILGCFL